ncbi:phosphotransferase [Spirilliplanes yamanashiensis]|uniref:Aminoglycoside phosphotransferase domain-containing protein n=1 Tax=Spirilliplanes yamanashiensis TaxID=42233 RepID=A0A8J3YDU4_9ACTN|nr:phosphotransferase [Spirilliplanes yamanashiensis]MDP9816361.1 Ser/Thr protein kinase RdoA (MazF antagonist) [Spirilliplanes yamanashiensis]GIJ05888.1 hypothetical protein Sya03_52400 [Spirilliplanes yamanashiensis]
MIQASGVRIGWSDLPATVHDAVAGILGGAVVEARSQAGGFSPGTADRVVTAGGRRAFVKAVGAPVDPFCLALHRREAAVAAQLPASAPVPRLLGVHDDGDWIALVLEDVDGRHPRTPWVAEELDAVVRALAELGRVAAPGLRPAAEVCGHDLQGWARWAADPPADADPWVTAHLPELLAAAERAAAAVEGDALVHADVRADNLLIRADGSVVVVDWPHACRGAAWLDRAMLTVNVLLYGGEPAPVDAPPGAVTDLLAGYLGFFTEMGRRPDPPTLPTLRAFQRAQAAALRPWVAERLTPRAGRGGR